MTDQGGRGDDRGRGLDGRPGGSRVRTFGGVMQRIGAIEGVAVLLLVSVGLVIFGLASKQTWPVVVGAILGVFTVADIVILGLVRRRFPR